MVRAINGSSFRGTAIYIFLSVLIDAEIFQDPAIKERVISFATGFASNPLKGNAPFAFRVIEYTLDAQVPDDKSCMAYSDAVKEFRSFCIHQLQRLAMRFPDFYIVSIVSVQERILVLSLLDNPR